jgi:hypothetical protein
VDFPVFIASAPLTEVEIEALRAMHIALKDLRHEYESALAVTSRSYLMYESAEVYTHGLVMTHHTDALRSVGRLASTYEQGVGLLCWRYASAAAVLGISVLERVVNDTPAPSADTVAALCGEPTLEQLRTALLIPAADLLITRDPDSLARHADDCQTLIRGLEGVVEYAAESGDDVAIDATALWAERLTDLDAEGKDPLYDGLLEGLLGLAGQLPNEISWYLRNS